MLFDREIDIFPHRERNDLTGHSFGIKRQPLRNRMCAVRFQILFETSDAAAALTQSTRQNKSTSRRLHILFFISQPSLANQKQQRSHADGDKRCRDCRKQTNYPFRADRKVADKLAGLTVHGKEEIFSLPPCIQDPDG